TYSIKEKVGNGNIRIPVQGGGEEGDRDRISPERRGKVQGLFRDARELRKEFKGRDRRDTENKKNATKAAR
ncbi:MAG TPA: hypothetical protein DDY31_15250, partial [Lachnospiraceae bacterium]|nr:hypothetical protein [Lachnospiraceae bacterium]